MKRIVRQTIASIGIAALLQSSVIGAQTVSAQSQKQPVPAPAKTNTVPSAIPAVTPPPAPAQKAAPAGAKPTPAKADSPKSASRIDDVIALVKAGFSEETVITSIRKTNKPMDLTPTEMVKLKQAGVTEKIINVLMDPSSRTSTSSSSPQVATTKPIADPRPPTLNPSGDPLALQAINTDLSSLACKAEPRKRVIAITEFDFGAVKSQVQAIFGTQVDIGKGIMALVTKQLQQEGKYRIVERANIQMLLNEQNMGAGNRVKQGSNAKIGKVIGADAFLMGTILTFGRDDKRKGVTAAGVPGVGNILGGIRMGKKTDKAVVTIAYKLVDAETTEVIDTSSESGESKRESKDFAILAAGGGGGGGLGLDMTSSNFAETIIGEATIACVRNLTAKMNAQQAKVRRRNLEVEGRIAQIRGNQVFITAGAEDGILQCDRFEVLKIIKEVNDPVTKEVIDLDVDKIGELVVTEARNRTAIGQFNGTQVPTENMLVRKIQVPDTEPAAPATTPPTPPSGTPGPPPTSQTLVPPKQK